MKIEKGKIEDQYITPDRTKLFNIYLEAVDEFVKRNEGNKLYEEILLKFKSYKVGLQAANCVDGTNYNIKLDLFRSHLVITKLGYFKNSNQFIGNEEEKPERLIFKQFLLDQESTKASSFKVHYRNIKAFLSFPCGFFIVLKSSELFIPIICNDFDVKGDITHFIRHQAMSYLDTEIEISSYGAKHVINLEIDEISLSNFFKTYDALKVNQFGDALRIKLGMNDSYIYEIINNKINNKLLIKSIKEVNKIHKLIPVVSLRFEDNNVKYSFRSKDECTFLSELLGILNDKQIESSTKKDCFFSVGKDKTKSLKINGIESVPEFRNKYERCLINKLMEESVIEESLIDELLLNGDFIGKQKVTIKKYINKCSKYLKAYFLLKKALKTRKIYEDELVCQFLEISNESKKNQKEHRDDELKKKLKNARLIYNQDMNRILEKECKGENIGIYEKSFKVWKLLTMLIKNIELYKEISFSVNVSQNESKIFINLLNNASKNMMQNISMSHSYICGKFLLCFVENQNSPKLIKTETLNKNLLINKKKTLTYLLDVTEYLSKILLKTDDKEGMSVEKDIFGISGALSIFESIIFKKKKSTLGKDLTKTLNLLINPLYFQIFVKLSLCKEPELIYKSSLIMNSVIECLNNKERVKDYQKEILYHSTLLLRHIEFCILPLSFKQKRSSILFIYHCLIDNGMACALMTRLIPGQIFNSVEEDFKSATRWTLTQWENLFKNLNYDFNTATVQWNQECRKELLDILSSEIQSFYSNLKPLAKTQLRKILEEIFKSEEFKISQKFYEEIILLKWNFEEYDVRHSTLLKMLPVYKYYIRILLVDKPNPRFSVTTINNPKRFWEELSTAFISTNIYEEKVIYLKCLILLYKDYHIVIRESTLISYVIKQLSFLVNNTDKSSKKLSYLYLQFILTFLDVEDKVIRMINYKRFIESSGLFIVLENIRSSFVVSNLNVIDYFDLERKYINKSGEEDMSLIFHSIQEETPIERRESKLSAKSDDNFLNIPRMNSVSLQIKNKSILKNKVSFEPSEIIFNYSTAKLQRESYTIELQNCNQIMVCIKIFQTCIGRTKSQFAESLLLTPKPLAKQIAFKMDTISLVQRLLLIEENYLINSVLEFISFTYMDKYHFKEFISNKWIFSLLIYKINEGTCMAIAKFFQEVLNNLLLTSKGHIKKCLKDIRCFNITSPVNNLSLYSHNISAWMIEPDDDYKDSEIEDLFHTFPGLFILPPYFWYTLLEKGCSEFVNLLYSETYDFPFLCWNKEGFNEIKEMLAISLSPVLESHSYNFKFSPTIIKYNFAEELVCGPIILKNWIMYENKNEFLSEENVHKINNKVTEYFVKHNDNILKNGFNTWDLSAVWITSDVLANLYKMNTNLSFRALNSIKSFFSHYNGFYSTEVDDNEEIEKMGRRDLIIKRLEQMDHKKEILNLIDDCILNCFKLLKNILKPETESNNFELFDGNWGLKGEILKLFHRSLKTTMMGKADYTINDLKLNLQFMAFLKNLYEKNGYTINSFFVTNNPNIQSPSSGQTITEKYYDIEHIITNLDLSIVKNFLRFSKKPQRKISELSNQDRDNYKYDISDSEEESESEESFISDKDNNLKKTPVKKEIRMNFFRNSHDYKFIRIKRKRKSSFKSLKKKMDFKGILNLFGNFDFSRTTLDEEFFNDLHENYPPIVYSELKKILHEFLEKWVIVIYKLSKNIKNCEKFIKSNLALRCFELCLIYQQNESQWVDKRLLHNINIFSKMCYRVFLNILTFSITNAVIFDDPDKDYIVSTVSKSKLKKVLNESQQYEGLNNNLILNFFAVIKKLFTVNFCIKIFTMNKNYITVFKNGVDELYCFVNGKLIKLWEDVIERQIVDQLKTHNFNKYNIFSNFENSELDNQPVIYNLFIKHYIKSPIALEKKQEIMDELKLILADKDLKQDKLNLILKFLVAFNSVNVVDLTVDSDFYELLLSLFPKASTESYYHLLIFFSSRINMTTQEKFILLENNRFYQVFLTSFFTFYESREQLDIIVRLIQNMVDYNQSLNFVEIAFILLADENIRKDLKSSCADLLVKVKLRGQQKKLLDLLAITVGKSEMKQRNDILETICSGDIVHPQIHLDKKKKEQLIKANLDYLKQTYINLEDSLLDQVYNDEKPDLSFLFDFNTINPNLTIKGVDLCVLLNNADNSFLYNEKYKDFSESVANHMLEDKELTWSNLPYYLSTLAILQLCKKFNILLAEKVVIIIERYIKNKELWSDKNDVLIYQLTILNPWKLFSDSKTITTFFFTRLEEIIKETSNNSKNKFSFNNLMFIQSLLALVCREGQNFVFEDFCSKREFSKIMLKLKFIFYEESKFKEIVYGLICCCIMNNFVDEESCQYIKTVEIENYFDILGADHTGLVEAMYEFNMIQQFPSYNTLNFWMEKENHLIKKCLMPLIEKPDLKFKD